MSIFEVIVFFGRIFLTKKCDRILLRCNDRPNAPFFSAIARRCLLSTASALIAVPFVKVAKNSASEDENLKKMVVVENAHSCVLIKDEEELQRECAVDTFPNAFERLSIMRKQNEGCDVFFVVGKEKIKFSAHRIILATASEVFYRNFFGSVTSKDGYTEQAPTVIPDIHPEVFELLLQFCYSNQSVYSFEIPDYLLVHLLYAAEKYDIRVLKNACFRRLREINAENCITILEQALFYEETTLINRCLAVIDENSDQIIRSHVLRRCCREALMAIIARDEFRPSSEFNLFQEVVEFAKQSCIKKHLECSPQNIRDTLGDLLQMVRFPLMSVHDLLEVARVGILTNEELGELFRFLADNSQGVQSFTSNPRNGGGQMNRHICPCETRQSKEDFYAVRRRTATEEVDWMSVGSTLFFQADHDVQFAGFGIYGFCDDGRSLRANDITVMFGPYGSDNREIAVENAYADDEITHIFFSEHPVLKANTKYYLCINLSGAEGRRVRRNINSIQASTVDIGSGGEITFKFDAFGGNGIFPMIYFKQ